MTLDISKVNPIVMVEITCAVFVLLLSASQRDLRTRTRTTFRLKWLCGVTFFGLISDSLAYIFDHPETNGGLDVWYLYLLNLLPFIMSNVILICYFFYCEAYLEKKTKLSKWVTIIPVTVLSANIAADIILFACGKLVYFDAGYYRACELPLPVMASYYVLLFYLPVVAFIRRKDVGMRNVLLFVSYIIPVVVAVIILNATSGEGQEGVDFALAAGAVSSIYIALILQRDINKAAIEVDAAHAALAENNARVLALEDNFESLYDVDLDTDDYDLYIKDMADYNEINAKLTKAGGFFADTRMNAERVMYPEDLPELNRVITKENILEMLSKSDHFDWWYRLMVDSAPVWFRMRFVYRNAEKKHLIAGIFNAEEEMEQKQSEEKAREMLIDRMVGNDALILVNHETDAVRILHDHNTEAYEYTEKAGYAALMNNFIDRYVAEPDREDMRLYTSVPYMRERLQDENEYSFLYRDMVTGEPVYHRATVVRYSDTEVLQSFSECHDEVLSSLANEKLTGQYDAVYMADLDRNTVRAVRASRVLKEGDTEGIRKYGEFVRLLAKKVEPRYRREWLNYSDPAYMKKAVAMEDHREFVYELPDAGDAMRRASIDVIERRNGAASLVLLSFMAVDDSRARELLMQRRMADQKIWLDFFVQSYTTAYTVDLTNDTFEILKMDPQIAACFTMNGKREDMECFIEEHIHPEDRELMTQIISKDYITERLRRESSFTFALREVFGEQVRAMKCVIVRGTDEYHVGLGFLDITSDLQKEQEQAERERLYQELVGNMSNDDGLFLIDCARNTRKTFHDRSEIAAEFNDDEKYSVAIGRYVDKCVADSDRDMMDRMTAPSYMLERTKNSKEYSVDFRDISTGVQHFYQMRIIRISDTEVLQSFARRDDEIIGRLVFKKIEDEYFALMVVDLDTGILRVLKNNPGVKLDKRGESMFYGPAMRDIASSFEGEYREFFEKIGDINYIRKRFAHEDKSTYTYRSHMGGGLWGMVTGRVISRHEDGTPSIFVMGFSLLDADANEQAELKGRLQVALHKSKEESMRNELLHSILHAARWTFIISAEDEVIGVQASDDLRTLLNADIPDGPMGWTALIYPDDRERVKAEFMAAVNDHSGRTLYDTNYRMTDRNGAVRWYRSAGRVFRHEDGFGEFFGMHIDITDQMAGRHLEEKWTYLKEFGDMVNSALWSMDIKGEGDVTKVYWSGELRHMFGFENKKDFPDELDVWSERLHPDDRQRVLDYLQSCIRSREEDVIRNVSYRFLRKNGEYGQYDVYGRMENHPDGTRKLYGIVKDVSAKEKYETTDAKE